MIFRMILCKSEAHSCNTPYKGMSVSKVKAMAIGGILNVRGVSILVYVYSSVYATSQKISGRRLKYQDVALFLVMEYMHVICVTPQSFTVSTSCYYRVIFLARSASHIFLKQNQCGLCNFFQLVSHFLSHTVDV